MRTHRYIPIGRLKSGDKTTIEIVSEPTAEWFRQVTPTEENGKRIVRFALMCDGILYFGDAYHVLHWDICQARGSVGCIETWPVIVGSMVEMSDGWRFGSVQEFGRGVTEDALVTARGLLSALAVWPSVIAALGGTDPVKLPRCGEERL